MNFNLTLISQAVAFAIFIWFTAKFVWPPLMKAVEARQKTIADGLAAAEEGKKSLAQAGVRAEEEIGKARVKANQIVDQANKRSNEMVDAAKATAANEGQRIVADARQETQVESNRAREQLRKEVAALAVAGASKLLGREIDAKAHADLLDKLALEIERG
jgi:F-type H+-transporting ATPase subunit b